jgi:uncharacterized membrane protein YgaE (UPF0421/DUF939 family)
VPSVSPADDGALRRLERSIALRARIRDGGRRVVASLPAIIQITTAVAASYAIAHWGLGHATPVLAVTVTLNSLGFARDARPRRVAETLLGILLGVALADTLSLFLGTGIWQLVVVLLVVFVVGRAVSPNPAFALAAALPSALVVLLPTTTGGPYGRTLDALVAAAVALLATALLPRDPGRAAARDRTVLFSVVVESVGSVVDSLEDADPAAAALALERLRRTQSLVDAWRASLDTAVAVARVSPWLRSRLADYRRNVRVLDAADLATRHLRTFSRRVDFLVRDGVPRPAIAGLVETTGAGIRMLGEELDDPQVAGAARSLLADLARRLDPVVVVPDAGIADASVVLLLRPLVVDLLVGTGMSGDDARALLPPI